MKIITEANDLQGKRVLVRVDWNVVKPASTRGSSSTRGGEGKVMSLFRINSSLPTIEFLQKAGAQVILATHLEEGSIEVLKPFVPSGVELLPNLRENSGEVENTEEFAKTLASQADVYVNEAFSVSHRKHASIVGVPKLLPSYAGIRFALEVEKLSKVFNPPHPFLAILSGTKIETKLPLVEKLLLSADSIFLGGPMAKSASEMSLADNPKISLPSGDLTALDSNDETLGRLRSKISEAKFVVWNGPLGQYETGYTKYTDELAQALAEAKTEVIVGGGDTLVTVERLNLLDKFSFVSTAGGAMLDFLANETLPGIEVLK